MTDIAAEFELANVGPGPDPCSLRDLAADNAFVVLLFQRDFYCTNCRKQVQAVAERYDEFTEREAVEDLAADGLVRMDESRDPPVARLRE